MFFLYLHWIFTFILVNLNLFATYGYGAVQI